MIPRFNVIVPKSLAEALEVKAEYRDRAKLYAGGTDLLIRMKQGVLKPEYVVYIGDLDELKYVDFDGKVMRIGASATLSEIADKDFVKERFNALFNAINLMATTQIRNKATLMGNLCNAAPSADTAPPLIAFDAEIVLRSKDGERVVPLKDFFKGPGKTDIKDDEIAVEVRVPVSEGYTSYLKFSHRSMVDIAVVGVATRVVRDNGSCKDVRVVLGAVAPIPMRAEKTEEFVRGKSIDEAVAEEAGTIASQEAKPITDVRATKEYRKHIVKVLTKRALLFSYQKAG